MSQNPSQYLSCDKCKMLLPMTDFSYRQQTKKFKQCKACTRGDYCICENHHRESQHGYKKRINFRRSKFDEVCQDCYDVCYQKNDETIISELKMIETFNRIKNTIWDNNIDRIREYKCYECRQVKYACHFSRTQQKKSYKKCNQCMGIDSDMTKHNMLDESTSKL